MKPKKHELKNIVWNYVDDKSKPQEKIHFSIFNFLQLLHEASSKLINWVMIKFSRRSGGKLTRNCRNVSISYSELMTGREEVSA